MLIMEKNPTKGKEGIIMNLKKENIILTRPYKTVYKDGDTIVKVFTQEHGKANVFNEALCHARVEESGLNIPELLSVEKINGQWALKIKYVEGRNMQDLMNENPDKIEEYMEKFVDLQLKMHACHAILLPMQKEKIARKINNAKDLINATIRYEICTRLDSMPNHTKLCHGDFNPSNVIVSNDETLTIVDWSHATLGNASGDAATTYLQFALKDQTLADLYLNVFCNKSDTPKQYVQKWIPIAAALQLTKRNEEEKDFLMHWIDILDFQ